MTKTARDLLDERLAKGEITMEEHDALLGRMNPPKNHEADKAVKPSSKINIIVPIIVILLTFIFFANKFSANKNTLSLNETRQLTADTPSIVWTFNHPGGSVQIDISSSGPLDFALLPTQSDLAFPNGPYNSVPNMKGIGTLSKSVKVENLNSGTYYLEVNADNYSKPVNFNLKVY